MLDSSSSPRRPKTPPELRIDRDEPDWDYSYDMTSRDWDYNVDAFNPLEQVSPIGSPVSSPPRRRLSPPRRSRPSRSRSSTPHTAAARRRPQPEHEPPSTRRQGHDEIQNICGTSACAIEEEPQEHSLFFRTFPEAQPGAEKRPEPMMSPHSEGVSSPELTETSPPRKKSMSPHSEAVSSPELTETSPPRSKSPKQRRSKKKSQGKVVLSTISFVSEITQDPPPGCDLNTFFQPPEPPKIQQDAKTAGVRDDPPKEIFATKATSPTDVVNIVGELEDLQDQLNALRMGANVESEAMLLSAVKVQSNLSQKRKDQLDGFRMTRSSRRDADGLSQKRKDLVDVFRMAKESGRDSPEALRIAYSSSSFDDAMVKLSPIPSNHVRPVSPPPPTTPFELPPPPPPPDHALSPVSDSPVRSKSMSSPGRDSPETLPDLPDRALKKSVRFAAPLITLVKYRPKTLPQDYDKLYFGKEELEELERDRNERIYEEQFETIAMDKSGMEVAVTFPVRRLDGDDDAPFDEYRLPDLADLSSSWSSSEELIEI